MKIVFPKIALSLGLTLLASCANIGGQQETLSSVSVCCTSFSTIQLEELAAGTQTVAISDESPVFDFPQGRSRFRGFLLAPSGAQQLPRRIRIASLEVGSTNVYTGGKSWTRYFHPAITFLDGARKPLSTVVAPLDPTLPDACGPHFGCAAVFLESSVPEGARSFVVHQPYGLLGRTTEQIGVGKLGEQTIAAGGALMFIPAGGSPGRRIIAVSTGRVQVTLLP